MLDGEIIKGGISLQILRGVVVVLAGTTVAATVSATVYLMTSHRDITWSYVDNMARKMAALAGRGLTKALPNPEL